MPIVRACHVRRLLGRSIRVPADASGAPAMHEMRGRMRRMTAAWILLIAGILAAAASACFVALAVLTGPAHGPFIEVVVIGAVVAVLLLAASVRIRRRASVKPRNNLPADRFSA